MQQSNRHKRLQRETLYHLTRSRRENPAFNCGETPSITIAFGGIVSTLGNMSGA
jgi:hypothetical protein